LQTYTTILLVSKKWVLESWFGIESKKLQVFRTLSLDGLFFHEQIAELNNPEVETLGLGWSTSQLCNDIQE